MFAPQSPLGGLPPYGRFLLHCGFHVLPMRGAWWPLATLCAPRLLRFTPPHPSLLLVGGCFATRPPHSFLYPFVSSLGRCFIALVIRLSAPAVGFVSLRSPNPPIWSSFGGVGCNSSLSAKSARQFL